MGKITLNIPERLEILKHWRNGNIFNLAIKLKKFFLPPHFKYTMFPIEITNKIVSFGVVPETFFEELKRTVVRKHWKSDDGENWKIIPIQLKQQVQKNIVMCDLVLRFIRGVSIYWDDPYEPMVIINNIRDFSSSRSMVRQVQDVEISISRNYILYVSGQKMILEED